MKPLKFGDLTAKADAIDAAKRHAQFEGKVKSAMRDLRYIQPLPTAAGVLYDYPYGIRGYGITVLREARNRLTAKAQP